MLTFPEMTTMPTDLHLAVRETYRRAMADRRTQREAFDLALALVLERQPQAPRAARRAVAVMLANEPYLVAVTPNVVADDPTEYRPAA